MQGALKSQEDQINSFLSKYISSLKESGEIINAGD